MQNAEKEFYATLGELSVKFATMEQLVFSLLEVIVNNESNIITATLIEKNNLDKNLEQLRKINRIIGFEETEVNKIIEDLYAIKKDRNLFIHGIWLAPKLVADKFSIICSDNKIHYKEETNSRSWSRGSSTIFTLEELKDKVRVIDALNDRLYSLIRKKERLNMGDVI